MALTPPRRVPGRRSQLNIANQTDFTGGLNLTADNVDIAPNEALAMQNVELDPRGGFGVRGAMRRRSNSGTVNSTRVALIAEGKVICDTHYFSQPSSAAGTAWSGFDNAATQAKQNQAGLMSAVLGSKLYWTFGGAGTYFVTPSAMARSAAFTQSGVAWQDDYSSPSGTHAPTGGFLESYAGFMFSGGGTETVGGTPTSFPNRLRWSHPGDGGSWRSFDYVDIGSAASAIRGLYACADHLFITTYTGCWALYGNSPETFRLVELSNTVGQDELGTALYCGVKTRPGAIFWSGKSGMMRWDGRRLSQIDVPLASTFNAGATLMTWVEGPNGPRLHVGSTGSYWIWDPNISPSGAWMFHKFGDGTKAVVPIIAYYDGGGTGRTVLAYENATSNWSKWSLDRGGTQSDDLAGSNVSITAYYQTGWLRGAQPTVRKMYRRPELVARTIGSTGTFTINAYKDYNPTSVAKTTTASTTVAGAGDSSGLSIDEVLRFSSIGPCVATSLKITGPTDKLWTVSDLTMKYKQKAPRS